jgi:hypothetical protein
MMSNNRTTSNSHQPLRLSDSKVFVCDSLVPQMFLWNLHQTAVESPNGSHTFPVDCS